MNTVGCMDIYLHLLANVVQRDSRWEALLISAVSWQGTLKQSRSKEASLQRKQESLKQLVDEKDAKLGNDAINSRANVERTAALRSKIEELEQQLATKQVALD